MTTPLTYLPTVHLNGTSREGLVEQQTRIFTKCGELLRELANATPHDRDYYVQSNPKAGQLARWYHNLDMEAVRQIMMNAEARAIAIDEQRR